MIEEGITNGDNVTNCNLCRATAFLENGEKEADSEHDMEKSSQTRLYCYIDLFADCTNFFNYILTILR